MNCRSCGDSVRSGPEKTGADTEQLKKAEHCGDCWGELRLGKIPDVITPEERRATMRGQHEDPRFKLGRQNTDS